MSAQEPTAPEDRAADPPSPASAGISQGGDAAPPSGPPYRPPVASLLTIGDPRTEGVEARVAALGLGQEHVPDLVRMAVDLELDEAPGESREV